MIRWPEAFRPMRFVRVQEDAKAMPLVKEGSTAPEFSALNQNRMPVTLADFRGKWLVLWWYPKADTPG